MNYRMSLAFVLFWNLCQSWLPQGIIADIDEFMSSTGISALDGNHCLSSIDGDYKATVGGLTYKFSNV